MLFQGKGLKKGSKLGPYKIVRLIGEGGMGEVYEAQDETLHRHVALKVITPKLAEKEDIVKRFMSEGQTLARLMHKNVVIVYSLGEENGVYYIAMEYVDGEPLFDYIKNKGAMPVDQALRYLKQMLEGTLALHERGIVHRDIKPRNLIIAKDDTVKIVDFGIAKVDDHADMDLTNTGVLIGSVNYLAPEVLKGQDATVISDIWSLGINFYEMIYASHPFFSKKWLEVADKVQTQAIAFPKKDRKELDPEVKNLISRMCEKNPQRRYQNIKDILVDVEKCLAPQMAQSTGPVSLSPAPVIDISNEENLINDMRERGYTTRQISKIIKHAAEIQGAIDDESGKTAVLDGDAMKMSLSETAINLSLNQVGQPSLAPDPTTKGTQSSKSLGLPKLKATPALITALVLVFGGLAVLKFKKKPNNLEPGSMTFISKEPQAPSIKFSDEPVAPRLAENPSPAQAQDSGVSSTIVEYKGPAPVEKMEAPQKREVARKAPVAPRVKPSPRVTPTPKKVARIKKSPPKTKKEKRPSTPRLRRTKIAHTLRYKSGTQLRNLAAVERGLINPPRLSWRPANRSKNYEVEVSKDKNFKSIVWTKKTSSTSVDWPSARPGQFYWRVRGLGKRNVNGRPSSSGTLNLKVPAVSLKSRYSHNVPGDQASLAKTPFELSWKDVPGARSYQILVSKDKSFRKVSFKEKTDRALASVNVPSQGKYYLKVKSLDSRANEIGRDSRVAVLNVNLIANKIELNSPQALLPPDGTSIVSMGGQRPPISFKWSAVEGATKYSLMLSASPQFSKNLHRQTLRTNKIVLDKELPSGKVYWRVRAETSEGQSSWSETFTFDVP